MVFLKLSQFPGPDQWAGLRTGTPLGQEKRWNGFQPAFPKRTGELKSDVVTCISVGSASAPRT